MKIYIAGKITGDPDYLHKFNEERNNLEDQGHTVLCPADLPEGMRPADYMRICLAMIDTADMVFFLNDYKQSAGAQLELEYCRYIGKDTTMEDEL